MDWWIWLVIILVGIIVFQAITKKPNASDKLEDAAKADDKQIQYKKKNFLTASEKSFLAVLRELVKHNLIVVPQVNLATVVQKVGEFKYQNELYRNVDFGIFDREYNLLLLIELNDSSHQQANRKARDAKVRDIASQAGIKIMTFYTDKPNKPDYVIERILRELKESDKQVS